MIVKINVTKDLLKIIPNLYIQIKDDTQVCVDKSWMFGGSHLLEDMSMILGIYDRAIEGTKDDPDGPSFNDEDTDYMLKLYQYAVNNLFYIESLIHQYVIKGGLKPGVYKCKDSDLIWSEEVESDEDVKESENTSSEQKTDD